MSGNTKLKPFNEKNLPLLVDRVLPLWSPPVGDDDFKRFNVEFIVRNNIAENNYHFELLEAASDQLLAAAFFTRKGDSCKVEEWYEKESLSFPCELKAANDLTRAYLRMMDQRTLSLMQADDIKLSLFISLQPGAGGQLLQDLSHKLHGEGWKNIYLWTDCECNWAWYEKHGFALVEEGSYQPFCHQDQDFKTYIYRKRL